MTFITVIKILKGVTREKIKPTAAEFYCLRFLAAA